MRLFVLSVAAITLLLGACSNDDQEVDSAVTPEQIEACTDAWQAEKQAIEAGALDDSTLKRTAYDCPDYATWVSTRESIGYSGSPNLIVALCTIEADSPVCSDPSRPGA